MAGLDRTDPITPSARHDGIAACRLCSSSDADAAHEWCPAVGGLVCGACCRQILLGDALRLAAEIASQEDAEALVATCRGCERGHRWFAERVHDRLAPGAIPC